MSFDTEGWKSYCTYNGMDTVATLELLSVIPSTNGCAIIYDFSRALQAPVLEAMLRGFRVDKKRIATVTGRLIPELQKLRDNLAFIGQELMGYPINPFASGQVQDFFYGYCEYPELYKFVKGKKTVSCGKQQLMRIAEDSPTLSLITRQILLARDIKKQLDFLATGIDLDDRVRTSFHISGTETGRWSSSENAFGTGTNTLNVNERMRAIFIADPGHALVSLDGAQAEARVVALLIVAVTGSRTYLDAILGADLHTTVARAAFPQFVWPEDPDKARAFAESYMITNTDPIRQVSKKLAHATNLLGGADGLARTLGLDASTVKTFQERYLTHFGHRKWHDSIALELQSTRTLTSLTGRRRFFHGRPADPSTLREAVAFKPQSTVSDLFACGLLRVYNAGLATFLNYGYDNLVFQVPLNDKFDSTVDAIREALTFPLTVTHEEAGPLTHTIPIDVDIGLNWGKRNKKNPLLNAQGLRKWEPDGWKELTPYAK